MTTTIQNTTTPSILEDIQVSAPRGWVVPEDAIASLHHHTRELDRRRSIAGNLPHVASRAEDLIARLDERLSIAVPVCYLRIDEGTSFHILLLVERPDYLSPKIHAARIMAEQYMYSDDAFDIHFVFSVRSENMLVNPITAQGYTLMHVQEEHQNAA